MTSNARHPHKRYMKNWILRPWVQFRIGFVSFLTTLVFAAVVGGYAYVKLSGLADVITALTGADDSVRRLVSEYMASVAWTAVAIGIVVSILNFALMIVLTHRMVGPAVAFARLIDALLVGDYGTVIRLRKGDAFNDVADRFNRLSAVLKQRHRPWHNDPR